MTAEPGPAIEPGGPAARRPQARGVVFWLSTAWLAFVVVIAALAPVLPLPDPNETGYTCARCGPFDGAILGGDSLGRDLFARTVFGARVSLVVGFLSIAMAVTIGGALGVVAGYFQGRTDALIMGVMDVLLAFPSLVLLLAFVTFVARNHVTITHVTVAIGVLAVAPMCRIIRATTLAYAQRDFVKAARIIGARHPRILWREVVPNVASVAYSYALIGVAVAVVAEGSLAFLGLSVGSPTATWGGIINDGRLVLRDAPHVAIIPSVAMFLTVLALNFVGDTLGVGSRPGNELR